MSAVITKRRDERVSRCNVKTSYTSTSNKNGRGGKGGNVFTHFMESRVSDIILDTMYKDPNEPINSDWSPPLASVGAFALKGYIMTSTGVSGCGWTANTTQPVEVATVDGMKPYDGYTIDVNE
jgi:hypothetical protein